MSQAYCWKCYQLVEDGDCACRNCGAQNPAHIRPHPASILFLSTIAASLMTVAYAYCMSHIWERWQGKFDRIPDGPFQGAGREVAIGIGVGVFVLSWSLFVFRYWVNQSAARGDRTRR